MTTPEMVDEARHKAKLFGFDYHTPLFCAVARPAISDPGTAGWRFAEAMLAKVLDDVRRIDPKVFGVRQHSSLVILCHVPEGKNSGAWLQDKSGYRVALDAIRDALGKLKDVPNLRMGAGRPGSGVESINNSYEEACSALRIAEKFNLCIDQPTEPVIFTDIRHYQLLDSLLHDEGKALLFCQDILGSFLGKNIKHQEEYLRTLESYLYYGKNLSEIQRNVGIHRNTVKYRIDRLEEELSVSFDDIQTCVNTWIALQIRKILFLKNHNEE